LGHKKGTYWAVIDKIELLPRTGIFQTPILELDSNTTNARIKLAAKARTPEDSEVRLAIMFGKKSNSGAIEWGDWKDFSPTSGPIQVSGSVMQIRAYLMAGMKGSPVVESLGFEIVP
jgi:hypothetical protein